jgi:hypothetical protein
MLPPFKDPDALERHTREVYGGDELPPDLQHAQLLVPETPPSLNKLGSRGSNFAWQREKKRWEGMCMISLLAERVPKKITAVRASATMGFKTNRRRDEGNFRYFLEKALGDVLQLGWIPDDTPEHFRMFGVDLNGDVKRPGFPRSGFTLVTMSYLQEAAPATAGRDVPPGPTNG